jgi:hypothetical protein
MYILLYYTNTNTTHDTLIHNLRNFLRFICCVIYQENNKDKGTAGPPLVTTWALIPGLMSIRTSHD